MTTTASMTDTRRYTGSYPAEPVQVRHVRAALTALLPDCPRADDAILVASEYATNSVVHSDSRSLAANSPSAPKSSRTTSGSK